MNTLVAPIVARLISWAVSIGLLVIPVGGVPQSVEYKSIQNPTAQVLLAEESVRRAGTLNKETEDAALAILRTFLGSITDPDIDRSALTRAIATLPVRGEADDRTAVREKIVPPLTMGVHDYQLFLIPTKDSSVYELAANYAQRNGKQMQSKTGLRYNVKTGELYAGDHRGLFGTKRNINLNDIFFFNEVATWQQRFGFNALYDLASPLLLYDLDCLRIKFPYEGKDWMFQLWKGSYTVVSNGLEIGVYEKPQSRKIGHYDCSDLMLPMEVALYHGEKRMLSHKMEKTWWITAFQPGLKINPKEMTMESKITFDDPKMQKLFVKELRAQGDIVSKIIEKGATVRFAW